MFIKMYNPQTDKISQPHFFILAKGNNTGKPMHTPCPNCFLCTCSTEEEKQKAFWVCYGLWQCGHFRPYLYGSVIPFIHIADLKKLVSQAMQKVAEREHHFHITLSMVERLEARIDNLRQQAIKMEEAKKAIMHQVLR